MAIKNKQDFTTSTLLDALDAIQNDVQEKTLEKKTDTGNIVDIMTFCDDARYLDLSNSGFNLYLSQRVILKTFYMKTVGNENLSLTKEEWDWLYSNSEPEERDGMTYEKNIKDVIRKIHEMERSTKDDFYFNELHLALGRRSSKTACASIITSYEAYKLLVIGNGNPHKYYNLPDGEEIAIINVALSQGQAGRLFGAVQNRIRSAPFFKNRVAKDTSSEIRLLTDDDIEKQATSVNIEIKGSILILCGHSNPDTLRGYNVILLLFDEIAFYDESGKVTGSQFYADLKPSLSKFYKYKAARIVQISSPSLRSGIFYQTFVNSKTDDSILSFQLPTWCVNPEISYDDKELQKDRKANEDQFAIEFGAQWATGGNYGNYFDEGLVDRCIRGDLGPHKKVDPVCNYYMHVDPAKSGNNYAAVLVAKERYTNFQGKKRNRIYLAGVWIFRPVPGVGLIFSEIDKKIIEICSIFHPISVTYDDYHSIQSLQLLKTHGINCQCLPYNRSTKMKVYQNMKDLMCCQPEPELYLYDDGGESSLLIAELKNLKFRKIARGISFVIDKHSDVKSDDLSDAIAGACCSANEGLRMSLPLPVCVQTGWR